MCRGGGAETKKYNQETEGQDSEVTTMNKKCVEEPAPPKHKHALTPCDSKDAS